MLFPDDQIWIIVVGFIIAFILSFGLGANDVANSFGTSVGSGVLTLKQACALATIFESLGSILMGAKVSDMIRKGVLVQNVFNSSSVNRSVEVKTMMIGQLSSLSGSCLWLITATVLKLPVSASHSIVGAVVGFVLVIKGSKGINWIKIGSIVTSWFISPISSGIASVLIFLIFDRFILRQSDPLEPGLKFLPFIYMLVIFINLFSIFISGPELLHFNKIPLYGVFVLSIGAAIMTLFVIRLFVVPYLRRKIKEKCLKELEKAQLAMESPNFDKVEISNNHKDSVSVSIPIKEMSEANVDADKIVQNHHCTERRVSRVRRKCFIQDRPEQDAIFTSIQIMTASFSSFAHGGNDVSNAIGPLVGLWIIGLTQDIHSTMTTPVWVLIYGAIGISIGLWVLGRRVIETIGEDLSVLTPSSAVSIELSSAITVVIASNLGIPISTTHCKVGSVVAVGRFRSRHNVDWKMFINIALAWLVTLPVTGGFSALFTFVLLKVI